MEGDIPREITQYSITATPQDGGPSVTFYVLAEEGASITVSDLDPETAYDIKVSAVIDTEGQGEETFDLGLPSLSITTGMFSFLDLILHCIIYNSILVDSAHNAFLFLD